ncbi:hypothetical protein AHF37_10319 [Paragonimus kellicotti]|nr:hypothetical protein AHF37_10319 [Paragonimus kellicotti]
MRTVEDSKTVGSGETNVDMRLTGLTTCAQDSMTPGIRGVVEYSLCLLFSKLVSYTFMFWLPNYISEAGSFNPTDAADLSAIFDLGGIAGGILAGVISDRTAASATICSIMLVLGVPMHDRANRGRGCSPIGNHSSQYATSDATQVKDGRQIGRIGRIETTRLTDVIGQPEHECVRDQFGEQKT